MTTQSNKEKIQAFYRDLCICYVGTIRAVSLYPPDHIEAKKRIENLHQRLGSFLKQRPQLTILAVNNEMVIEGCPLPELTKTLSQFIQRMEDMRFQRLVISRGISRDELISFLQFMIRMMKRPETALEGMAENQGRFKNITAGVLPRQEGPEVSYDDLSGALQDARRSAVSFSGQIRDVFDGMTGSIPAGKVALAKEITGSIFNMNLRGDIPLKALIYRKSTDSDPYMHSFNVCAFSMALAHEIRLGARVIEDIGLGALLHDTGFHVQPTGHDTPDPTGSLGLMAGWYGHPQRGAEILLATEGLPDVVPLVAYEHHIHYDGGGYPKDMRHRDLSLASMITCITDSYDNLRRDQPGQHALTLTEAVDWMDRRFGTQFHPILFKKFRAMVKAQAKEEI
jgi:HD-GYP domain-containing protein (c-di-GMP phosphodiesterase class II)